MAKDCITGGYLDVKISTKTKRGFTPWKAWKKQWCEIKRIDNIDNGVEIKIKNSSDSNSANCFVIPRNATICRTESRSKHYCFGIFGADRCHKPLLFLSGLSETESQLWIHSLRKMLSISSHLPVSDGGFYVSLVENDHSRIAGLTGLHGILTTNSHEVIIKHPFSGDTWTTFNWNQLHQFHLSATGVADDERKIVVLHTSKDFRAGAGQLYLFCLNAPTLLQCLVARGKIPQIYINSFMDTRRFSRSEGDLRENSENSISVPTDSPTSPVYYRSHSGSDDSGVRVSMASDDSSLVIKCKKAASFISLGFGLLVATPGGSEIDSESRGSHELLLENEEKPMLSDIMHFVKRNVDDPRRESGVSITSGVYEEIPDLPPPPKEFQNDPNTTTTTRRSLHHTYEDPVDVMLGSTKVFAPPPLPPRRDYHRMNSDEERAAELRTHLADEFVRPDANVTRRRKLESEHSIDSVATTLTDLESEYMVMTPVKPAESFYMVMQADVEENTYMVMNGSQKK